MGVARGQSDLSQLIGINRYQTERERERERERTSGALELQLNDGHQPREWLPVECELACLNAECILIDLYYIFEHIQYISNQQVRRPQ